MYMLLHVLIVLHHLQMIKQSLVATIPDEPSADCQETMARLRFRCPDGDILTRRFLGSTQLQTLLNYLVTLGYSREEYKVLTTFPRRDVSLYSHHALLQLYVVIIQSSYPGLQILRAVGFRKKTIARVLSEECYSVYNTQQLIIKLLLFQVPKSFNHILKYSTFSYDCTP